MTKGPAESLNGCATILKNLTKILVKLYVLIYRHTILEILLAYPLKSPNLSNFMFHFMRRRWGIMLRYCMVEQFDFQDSSLKHL